MSGNKHGLNLARRAHRIPLLLSALLSSASIAALVLIPQRAEAQSTWQGTTSDYNTAGNWNNSTVPASPGRSAIFGATGNTAISVSGPVAPDSWTFNSSSQAYAITGSPVSFNTATGGIIDNSSANISIDNNLGGVGGVNLAGTGTLTLTGANTYSGGTIVIAGTL